MRGRLLLPTNHRQSWALNSNSLLLLYQASPVGILCKYLHSSLIRGEYRLYFLLYSFWRLFGVDDILKMHSCWSRFPWYFFIIIVTIDSELPPSSILTPSLKIGIDPANQLVGDLTVVKIDGDEVMSRLSAGLDMWGSAGNGEERETLMIE
jgi:hypothetical protein